MNKWVEADNALCKTFLFTDFREAFSFMTSVAKIAEELDHHPEWSNLWNVVHIKLRTMSAGNSVTNIDREMAKKIDALNQ